MKKSSSIFLLKPLLSCALLVFCMTLSALQKGDQIDVPALTYVYPDNGSNCKDFSLREESPTGNRFCTIGYGDTVRVLDIYDNKEMAKYLHENPNSLPSDLSMVALEYSSGGNNWKEKCEPDQILCSLHEEDFRVLQRYLAPPKKVESVDLFEKPAKDLLGYNNSTSVVEGQVFSMSSTLQTELRFFDDRKEILDSLFSFQFISYATRQLLDDNSLCYVVSGDKLKVVGFNKDQNLAYVRLMEREREVNGLACPENSLHLFSISELIRTNLHYSLW